MQLIDREKEHEMSELAAFGGSPVRKEPFAEWPRFQDSAIEAACDVLRSRKVKYYPGGAVSEFEEAFAAFCNSQFGICVFNGTVSLEIGMRCVGVTADSEVIISAYDHPANINSVMSIGAVPRFADVEYERPNMSPASAETLVNDRTKAIVVTHMVGLADVDAFERISAQHGIPVIYDCAREIGSEWKGQPLGQFGTASSFSFEESKLINAGEGGAIVTNDQKLAERIYAYRDRGRDKHKKFVRKGVIGGNYRMTELQAACLKPQLFDVDRLIQERAQGMNQLREFLNDIEGVRIPTFDERCTKMNYYNITLRYDRNYFNRLELDRMIGLLNAEGIPCKSDWQLPYRYADQVGVYLQSKSVCPTAEKVYSETIMLHGSILHSGREDLSDIVKALKKIENWSKST